MTGFRARSGAIALIALLVLSAVGPGLVAAATLNFSADKAPMRYVQEDQVTIAEHDMTEMSGALEYEGDDGDVTTLPAEINSSRPAPIGVSVEKINESEFRTFPRVSGEDGNSITWTDSTNWTTSTTGTATVSLTETTPAGDVKAITVDASVSGSDGATATYDDFNVTSDATKRVGMVGANVDTLASGAVVEIRFVEDDGDYVALEANGSENATADGVIANATGEGWVEQQRLGSENMTVEGSGDGTLSEINQVEVNVTGGDAKVELFWLDVEKKSEVELGKHYTDGDDDDTLPEKSETLTDKDFAGEIRMSSLSELSALFDNSVLYDKTVRDIRYTPEYVDSEDLSISYSDADDYPTFDKILEGYYRIHVPAPIDVTHGTLALEVEQRVPSSRFITTEYALDTGDKSFENASYTSFSSWGSVGDRIEVSTAVSGGDKVIWHDEIPYTSTELESLMSSSAAGGPVGSGSGGLFGSIFGFFTTLPGIVLGGALSFLGLRRFIGGS